MWKTTDAGDTWVHYSEDGNLEQGRPWGDAIAPDGSYMLALTGYGPPGVWKSVDGGRTWRNITISAAKNDPYMVDIDPLDKDHVIASMHAYDDIFESFDAGETWINRGSANTGLSNYVFFIDRTTWLSQGQFDSGNGTWRTTDSGATWNQVGPMEHPHGNSQIYIDSNNGDIYVGAGIDIYRSTDGGASFSLVSDISSSAILATPSFFYSQEGGATMGFKDAAPARAPRSDGTDWTRTVAFADLPAGMTNGTKRADVSFDPIRGKWVIISGNWCGGIWRYIEP
jgi:photosystem II stability/assembly factor-like uncharacterized protein